MLFGKSSSVSLPTLLLLSAAFANVVFGAAPPERQRHRRASKLSSHMPRRAGHHRGQPGQPSPDSSFAPEPTMDGLVASGEALQASCGAAPATAPVPESAVVSEAPAAAAQPAASGAPAAPAGPVVSESPAVPAQPVASETPAVPATPVVSPSPAVSAEAVASELATAPVESAAPAQDVAVNAVSLLGTKKRGICYNDWQFGTSITSDQVGWAVNWDSFPEGNGHTPLSSGIKFYPMLWGNKADTTGKWKANAEAAIAAGADVVFGFNEPNPEMCNYGQSCIDPAAAVASWKEHILPLAREGIKLVAPSIPQGADGQQWLESFFDICAGSCKIDAIALHWYETSGNTEYFKNYFAEAHANPKYGGLPIYVTEFQGFGTTAELAGFYKVVNPWLESTDYIAGYSAFNLEEGILVSGGQLNEAATTYLQT